MRLDPGHPEIYLLDVGWAYLVTGRYREAADALGAAQPNNPFTHVGLIYAYMKLGREQDARAEVAQVLRRAPDFSVEEANKRTPGDSSNPSRQDFVDVLRKAGLR